MNYKHIFLKSIIGLAYIILLGLLVFNVLELTNKYQKEELKMIVSIEKGISEALNESTREGLEESLNQLKEEHSFDIVITEQEEVLFSSIPYEKGDTLINRVDKRAVASVSQGEFGNAEDGRYMWYAIYKLSDSAFMNSFLKTLLTIVLLVTALLALTVSLIAKSLFDPLKNIKESLEYANEFEFQKISEHEEYSDNINKSFQTFVSGLETSISAVTREHTELEKQLQMKREHLNNIVVVSRSMVHDLKTPIHRNIMENDILATSNVDNPKVVEVAKMNQEQSHHIMLEVNRILSMLKNDAQLQSLDIVDTDIVGVLMRSVSSFTAEMKAKNTRLEFDVPPEVVIPTEESTFTLLVNNLLSNMVLYTKENAELSIVVEEAVDTTSIIFTNESSTENIERMKSSENLFNAVKDPNNDQYIYSSGNGLYLIKDLTLMLGGSYHLETKDNKVIIKVVFKNEKE